MKKTLLSTAFLFALFNLTLAQDAATDKGIIFFKGGSGMNISLSDGTPISLSAGGGYFFMDNILGAIDLSYFSFDGSSDITLRPFARYYFKEKFFGGVGAFQYDKGIDESAIGLDIEGGYMFYLNDYVVFEPMVYFPFTENSSISLRVAIGIYY